MKIRTDGMRFFALTALTSAACLMLTSPVLADRDNDERYEARGDYDRSDCEGDRAIALVNGKIHTMDSQNSVVSSQSSS